MARTSGILPNLLGGISQQPDVLRHPTQLQAQFNMSSSVVDGLTKRAPLEYYAYLGDDAMVNDDAFLHTIDRDPAERYVMFIEDETLFVYDIVDRDWVVVNSPDGVGYLNTTNRPDEVFRAVTVADHTFIVNTEMVVDTLATLSGAGTTSPGVIVNIQIPSNGTTYTIIIEGTGFTTLNVSTTTAASGIITLDDIAGALVTAIDAVSGWTVQGGGGSIYIERDGGLPADASVIAFANNTPDAVLVNYKRVQSFTDLATFGAAFMTLEVAGDPGTEFDNFYVNSRRQGVSTAGGIANLEWLETVQPGIEYLLDPATMPHLLVRENDGTFTFREADWSGRDAGDLTTNPWPTFVGETIKDVFFFKNRLGFLSGENAILSEVGSYFNFFRTTATASLDSDPVDVSVSTNQVAHLERAALLKGRLFAFSSGLLFELVGDPLTPSSAALTLITQMDSRALAGSVVGGSAVYIPFDRGDDFSGLTELLPDATTVGDDLTTDVSEHVPRLIGGEISTLAYSDLVDTVFIHSHVHDRNIYCYKVFWRSNAEGREKVLSSWALWNFGIDIVHITVLDQYLYLVFHDQPTSRVYLGRIDLREGIVEDSDWDWRVLLDFRVAGDHDDVISAFAAGNTTFTLPYRWIEADDPLWVIDMDTTDRLTPTSINATTGQVVFNGVDLTEDNLLFGLQYQGTVEFSMPIVRSRRSGQDSGIPIPHGDLYLLFWSVNYAKSGRVRAKVHYPDGSERGYTQVANVSEKSGGLESGSFRFPVRASTRRSDILIELINDRPYPSNFVVAGWEGNFVNRTPV